ncbi:MAG: hypothetical protein HOF74_10115 [Gammaproteobacteria bacterium]|jgi:hypothetical protein|nr:hypothetical protein [Gammaproteobacteria bacterium]MBT3860174.1 hypothetical protein [Gammaproteobacteria bacterium]MBT3987466.1 hypothetical protein [Gammaproteobacteria bacterium]MBT4255595.1 hypothetical protein [Gammaproteobacteria bacterium]MBT4581796.1 hypothetical protein [Gammaproteobacteria bacterium]
MKKKIRHSMDIALTALGIGVIFTAVIMGYTLEVRMQLPIALFGVLLMEAGIWGLSAKLFPNERKFITLRAELDGMVDLVRELNSSALSDSDAAGEHFDRTLAEMHESVNRMSQLAGIQAHVADRK